MRKARTLHEHRPRKFRRVGDLALIKGESETKLFKTLVFNPAQGLWEIFVQFMQCNMLIQNACVFGCLRFKYSPMIWGIGITLAGTSLMLVYNSIHVWPIFSFLYPLAPLVPIFWDWEIIKICVFDDIYSNAMFWHTVLFLVISFAHTLTCYIGSEISSKRGNSLINALLSKFIRTNEIFISAVLEPVLVIGFGFIMWIGFEDYYYAIFLWIAAASEIWLQLVDKSHQIDHQNFIEM
ncbi:MAG: hypothetical protein RIC35_02575 [Marinoscillum sp.]